MIPFLGFTVRLALALAIAGAIVIGYDRIIQPLQALNVLGGG